MQPATACHSLWQELAKLKAPYEWIEIQQNHKKQKTYTRLY